MLKVIALKIDKTLKTDKIDEIDKRNWSMLKFVSSSTTGALLSCSSEDFKKFNILEKINIA